MGDPACWMHEVCLDCGRISEDRRPGDPCPNCSAEAPVKDPAMRFEAGS